MAEAAVENETSVSADEDLVNSTTNAIVEILEFDEDEMGEQIARDLLENGRKALITYEADIVQRVYEEAMDGDDSQLMSLLKRYFRQQWETQFASSHPWFISFLNEYEHGDSHDIYEAVLSRTARNGEKYMKDFPLLSIVLQLLFEDIDDDCFQETNGVFDELWLTITNDGLQSITKYSNYIAEKVLNEQLAKDSVLFKALREYYRPHVLASLTKSAIKSRQSLYDLALDDVVEHGWLSEMTSIQSEIAPNRYQILLKELRSPHKKENDLQSDAVLSSNIGSLSLVKRSDESESVQSKDPSDDPNSESMTCPDSIYVTGLPTNMSNKQLIAKLHAVFAQCGAVKRQARSNQPDIYIFAQKGKGNRRLVGTAKVGFENEEGAMMAIGRYNNQEVPELFNARISVRFYRTKAQNVDSSSEAEPTVRTRPNVPKSAVLGAGQPPRDHSVSSNSSLNSISRRQLNEISGPAVSDRDTIYITGLPKSMPETLLFDTLWKEFSTVGPIKIDVQTSKPCVQLYKMRGSNIALSGTATVTFVNEESVGDAIRMYNGKSVSSLSDRALSVRRYMMNPTSRQPQAPRPLLPVTVRPPGQPVGPVSIFWDIENVPVPIGESAFEVVSRLRQRLIEGRNLSEGTFKSYCRNMNTIPAQHRSDFHHANIVMGYIGSAKSGAMDLEIHMDLQQFRAQHKTPATVVLISGNVNFIKDINELRYRDRHYTIIIHHLQAQPELLRTANEAIPWTDFVQGRYVDQRQNNLPTKTKQPQTRSKVAETSRLQQRPVKPPTASTDDDILHCTSSVTPNEDTPGGAPSHSHSPITTTIETSQPVGVNDDGIAASSAAKDESVSLQTHSRDNEELLPN